MPTVEIILPKLGESVAEAVITRWLKKPGDQVTKDETICEVGTDKVETELPSEYEGVLEEIMFAEDSTVAVGHAS